MEHFCFALYFSFWLELAFSFPIKSCYGPACSHELKTFQALRSPSWGWRVMSTSDTLTKEQVSGPCQTISLWTCCLPFSQPFSFQDFHPELPSLVLARDCIHLQQLQWWQRSPEQGQHVSFRSRRPGRAHPPLSPTLETLSSPDTKPSQLVLEPWPMVAAITVTSLKEARQLAGPGGCSQSAHRQLCGSQWVLATLAGARQKVPFSWKCGFLLPVKSASNFASVRAKGLSPVV